MKQSHLRIFPNREPETLFSPPAQIRVRLRDLLPLIAMAQRMNMVWLRDFLDDEVMITSDLAEVLHAYHACRPSA